MTDYTSITDLLGNKRFILKGGRPLNERAGLIKYFCDTFHLNPKRLAPKMAHIPTNDLYPLMSQVKDRVNRNGIVAARRFFYWSIRTEKV